MGTVPSPINQGGFKQVYIASFGLFITYIDSTNNFIAFIKSVCRPFDRKACRQGRFFHSINDWI